MFCDPLYINYANHAPGVQIGHDLGVICSHRLLFKKTEKFSETMRPSTHLSVIDSLSFWFDGSKGLGRMKALYNGQGKV